MGTGHTLLSRTTRPSFRTLLDALALTAAGEPPAIIYLATGRPPITISRQAFRETTAGYAQGLCRLGIRPRDLVVIAHTQNLESIYIFWGALRAGAIPAMFPTLTEKLDPAIYRRQMAELVHLSGVTAVFTADEFAPILDETVGCPVYGSAQLAAAQNPDTPAAPFALPNPDQLAFLQHSSGTTGLQKGVALSHTAVLNQIASYSDAIRLHPDDVIVSWLPLYHDMGLIAGFLLPLIQGLPLVLMSPFDWVSHPALLLQAIDAYGGTLCWLPNFAYNHCARRIRQQDKEGVSLASMRLFINCSEPVRHDSHELFLEAFAANEVTAVQLGVSYAMAENTFGVTQTTPGETAALDTIDGHALSTRLSAQPVPPDHPHAVVKVSCGRPIPDTAVAVLDEQHHPLPDRHVGQLAVQSNCMLSGYYRRPDLQPFHHGWYLTGDRGYRAEGEIYVIGRSKDLIINAGKNVYPQDIEAIVNTIPGVIPGRAVCFGVPDAREGTELIAVVAEVTTEDRQKRKALNKMIRQEVGRQSAVTVSFVHLVGPKWLIKTSSGKIARAANRDKWLAERQRP